MEQREHKYRAWNREEKIWMYFVIYSTKEAMKNPDCFNFFGAVCDSNLYKKLENWCEFTSLKDSKGVEIYEGDICKNGDWEEDAHTYNYRVEEVEWNKDNACWQGWNPNEDGMICEVIGNIYEDKNLSKGK